MPVLAATTWCPNFRGGQQTGPTEKSFLPWNVTMDKAEMHFFAIFKLQIEMFIVFLHI